jgi:hypothetical protein
MQQASANANAEGIANMWGGIGKGVSTIAGGAFAPSAAAPTQATSSYSGYQSPPIVMQSYPGLAAYTPYGQRR